MSAMVLDAGKVNAYVIPNLSKAKTTLTDASKYGNSIVKSTPDSPLASRSNLREAKIRNTASDLAKRLGVISNNINTISLKLDNKVEKAKLIEKKNKAKTTAISAAVGAVAGVAGAAIGAATGGVKGAVIGAAVGAAAGVAVKRTNIVSSIGKALKNTGAKIAKNVGNFFSNVWKGIKNIGKSIWDACKKIANKVVSFFKEKIAPVLKKIGEGALAVLKFLGRTAATIVTLAVSLVEGVVSLVEALGDVVLLVVGGVCSIVTALADVVRGICTGEWDWKCTSAVWKKWIMPWVGYDWTSKAFDYAAPVLSLGLDKYAFKWAQRGQLGYKIGKGVGYVAGIIVASVFTAGGAAAFTSVGSFAAAASSSAVTLTSTAIAGAGKLGQKASENYNSVIDKDTKAYYVQQLKQSNPGLSDDEIDAIVTQNIKDGVYADYNQVRKSAMDNISGGKIAGIIGTSTVQGGVEAATWYITYGNGGSKLLSTADDGLKLGKHLKNVDALGKLLTDGYKIGGKTLKTTVLTKAAVQASKEFINEGATVMMDGDYDLEKAGTNALISAGTSIIYDKTAGALFKAGYNKGNEIIKAREEAAKATADVFDDIADVADDNIAKNATQQVSKTFKEKLNDKVDDVIVALNPALKYASKDAGGKKVVGGGVKSVIKEGEKSALNFIQNQLAEIGG